MTGGLHLSVRVPWHDSGWSGTVCRDPLGNASCVLLKNIGEHRDDDYEAVKAGKSLDVVDAGRVPCVSDRGTFLSPHSYLVKKEYRYAFNAALKGKLQPTPVTVPAYGVHATPYFWLRRDNISEVLRTVDVEYREDFERSVDEALGFSPDWVTHGDNQQALITRFFEDVVPDHGLVFFYLKHSPFTAATTSAGRSLLVGAARVTGIELPGHWLTTGTVPFPSYMWETSVRHSLRPDGTGGIVLPLAGLATMDLDPDDMADALAWAPEYGGREFSYVTEHVSDDTAIAALERLYRAARACHELGLDVPAPSLDWVSDRIAELWTMRGPVPGLGAALEVISVPHGPVAARRIAAATPEGNDPWATFESLMASPDGLGSELRAVLGGTPRKVWHSLTEVERATLRLLARFNLTGDQARALFNGATEIELTHEELLADPYHAFTCLLGGSTPVAFDVVDRGCLPEPAILARYPLPEPSAMVDAADARRVQALLVAVLEDAAEVGDTVVPLDRVLDLIADLALVTPCQITAPVLRAHDLHPADLEYDETSPYWPPLCGAVLADGRPAYKLTRLETTARVIRSFVDAQLARPRHEPPDDLRSVLDQQLDKVMDPDDVDTAAECRAREEKVAALAELFASPLSVLNGRAGTGKTTLIRALAHHDRVQPAGVLLLAPTGKARVQLTQKVKLEAHTLAQFLGRYGRYDAGTGAYLVDGSKPKAPRFGTVVVDESSMLTEEQLAALLDALHAPDRLILVGDPRQLPPIGAGRPFVDLITRMTVAAVPAFPKVAPGYAELTVLRRQAGGVRDDLMLAAWFSGDEIPDGFEEVWHRLRTDTPMPALAAIPWRSSRPDHAVDEVLAAELGVTGSRAARQFELSYGGVENGLWVNFRTGDGGAGKGCEKWQILSPTRTHPWGTVEINRRLKHKHRSKALRDAQRPSYERTTPKPIGPEQIVLGDKVLNNRNERKTGWSRDADTLDYVANGEIGVVVGQTGKRGSPPKYTNVEFSSQVGTTYGYTRNDEDDPALELAWAITVHKAQGSEFEQVFVMLPGSARRLSRELLYTALTRQRERVVLLHERPVDDLFELTRSTASETARRLTDLFASPNPRTVQLADRARQAVLDANLVHVTGAGVLVRSRNEVVVAGILDAVAPGQWAYEQPLTFDGLTRYPDFTIERADGRRVFWEHLGLLDNPVYAEGWERKLRWYREHGILPLNEGDGPAGTLIWTDDRDGIDVPAWTELAQRAIGQAATAFTAPARKAAKKAAPRVVR